MVGFHSQPVGIFKDIPDEVMEKHLCGEIYQGFDGRDSFKTRCTHLKKHSGEHGWISDREFKQLKAYEKA